MEAGRHAHGTAPGSGGAIFATFNATAINATDQVAFQATLQPIVTGPVGIFTASPGGPTQKAALAGDPAPGVPGAVFEGLTLVGIGDGGQVAYLAFVNSAGLSQRALSNVTGATPSGTNRGIWVYDSSALGLSPLVLNTHPTPFGASYSYGPMQLRGFNDTGQVLFQSDPTGGGPGHALFLKDVASPATVIFQRGQPTPGGGFFEQTQQASVNNAGEVVFLARTFPSNK